MKGDSYSAVIAFSPTVFQSTPPHGGRPQTVVERQNVELFQSTPPHGGRRLRHKCQYQGSSFNPRPRMGGDYFISRDYINLDRFQSTPPHGGRPSDTMPLTCLLPFQSTPPHGGRPCRLMRMSGFWAVSIHAPAWGATVRPAAFERVRQGQFQSTPPHGGRPSSSTSMPGSCSTGFNPRPRMGGD